METRRLHEEQDGDRVAAMRSLYQSWSSDGDELLDRWSNPARLPVLRKPAHCRWASKDGKECHTVIGWSDDAFDRNFIPPILDVIAESCVDDRAAWRYQHPAQSRIIGDFFSDRRGSSVFNLVTVTPSRVPRGLWKFQGRPSLAEALSPTPRFVPRGEPVKLRGLVSPIDMDLRDWLWADRVGGDARALQLALSRADRMFDGVTSQYYRVYELDRERDADAIVGGSVPAVDEAVVGEGLDTRTEVPMIHLWKLYSTGRIDLINIETSRGSGCLADIRWTSQPLDEFIRQDPYFGAALLELELRGKRLVTA